MGRIPWYRGLMAVAALANAPAAPVALVAPTLAGTGKIGAAHGVTDGTWSVTPDATEYRWRRGGAVIAGAAAAAYTPVAADDLTTLSAEVRARKGDAWSVWTAASGAGIAITFNAPVKSADLAAQFLTRGVAMGAGVNFGL